ncbi:hypothetical protein FPV67DRAFT_1561742 [Lyophyllum atratum]|nr:hypothetical protein FPV67DRAFT_1561742 [Lyophyllum atratum]
MRIAISSIVLFVLPTFVLACEGECIVGITQAFLSNYTTPITILFDQMANQIATKIIPNRRYASPPISIFEPILSAYHKDAYTGLENAIFPSYFHGKCQQPDQEHPDGPPINPVGCPNPDCPVVCGTPGSMVHFYSELRFIAFNETRVSLQAAASLGSKAYQAVERNIMREADHQVRLGKRSAASLGGTRMPRQRRQEQKMKNELREIINELPGMFLEICGGTRAGVTNGLPLCSWKEPMKAYILSFP